MEPSPYFRSMRSQPQQPLLSGLLGPTPDMGGGDVFSAMAPSVPANSQARSQARPPSQGAVGQNANQDIQDIQRFVGQAGRRPFVDQPSGPAPLQSSIPMSALATPMIQRARVKFLPTTPPSAPPATPPATAPQAVWRTPSPAPPTPMPTITPSPVTMGLLDNTPPAPQLPMTDNASLFAPAPPPAPAPVGQAMPPEAEILVGRAPQYVDMQPQYLSPYQYQPLAPSRRYDVL